MSAILLLLSGPFLAGGALAQALPGMSPQMMEMQRCRELVERAPRQSLTLAESMLARPALDPATRAAALGCRMLSEMFSGQRDGAQATAEELAAALDDPAMGDIARVNALLELARISEFLGQPRRAAARLDEALVLGERLGSPTVRLNALVNLANTHAFVLHDPAGAEPYFQQAIAIVQSVARPPLPQDAGLHLGYAASLLERRKLDEARVQVERAERILRSLPNADGLRSRAIGTRGLLELENGRYDQARLRLGEALTLQRRLGDRMGETASMLYLAKVDLKSGQPRQALADTAKVLEIAERGGGGPLLLVEALTQMAEVHEALGDSARAAEYSARLQALAGEAAAAQMDAPMARMRERAQAPARIADDLAWNRREFVRNSLLAVLALLVLAGGIALARLRRRQRRLIEAGATDPLTGLLNRREAGRRIEALEIGGQRRNAVLLVDVDRFKAINDQQGHVAGDEILVRIAAVLRACCDDDDIVARWGGEEFLVVRANTSQEAAFALAEHLRESIQRADALAGDGIEVTVSLGVASSPFFPGAQDGGWQEAVGLADRALYVAKHAGRNAWAGLWGLAEGRGVDLYSVRQNPEAALAQGWIAIGGNRPMSWSPVREGEPDASYRHAPLREGEERTPRRGGETG
ncbi:GGDEF domain-containing protein [Pseudoxanthomonas broegbernensis]|nr:diguanylate cyclase [Pseudoxanthomonas broegbernensis]MBB6065485.1 diguanylate cyclase (GGDEF)-like protein [Pseudoxanthomonas broegbernensis]